MKTFLLFLSALVAVHAQDDPCLLNTWTQPGCAAGTSRDVSVSVDQVRSCQQPSIWWNYPCGTLNAVFASQSNFQLCITGGLGLTSGISKIVSVAADGTQTPVSFPSTGKPSCVASLPSTKSIKLIFTASKSQTYGAGVDYFVL